MIKTLYFGWIFLVMVLNAEGASFALSLGKSAKYAHKGFQEGIS